jgi:DNA-binding NarL/FixJ family response regulator
MINVMVGSSVFAFREGIKSLLLRHKDMRMAYEATYMEEAIACDCSKKNHVFVAIAPLHFKEEDEACEFPDSTEKRHLVVVTLDGKVADVQEAIKMGARGIITKSCSEERIFHAIRTVAAGKLYVAQEISTLIASSIKAFSSLSPLVRLTRREMEILKRVAIGRRMSTISGELGISCKTVSAHKANIMEKLALGSDSELVLYAMKHDLFDLFVDHSKRKQSHI